MGSEKRPMMARNIRSGFALRSASTVPIAGSKPIAKVATEARVHAAGSKSRTQKRVR